jgi:calcium-translocating P-type ATPase
MPPLSLERPAPLTSFFAGDPVAVEATSASGLLEALGLPARGAGALALAPRVTLVHALAPDAGSLALRWVLLVPPADLGAGVADCAVVLTGPLREAGRALRLAGRLRAVLGDPRMVEAAAGARHREELVRAFRAVDHGTEESPLPAGDVLALLGTGAAGLDGTEAERRLAACGPNVLERVRRRSLLLRLGEQFVTFFAVLLWVGGGLALLAGMPELGWAIFAVIVVNGVFSFLQEYRAERAVQALERLLPPRITVVRGGREVRLPTAGLVPGDVIRLEEGDQVPADAQVLAASGLRVDQSALTGEAHPAFKLPVAENERERVPRLERHELLFAGTSVVAGGGTAVVLATGMATEIGAVARLTQAVAEEPSPLQREMARVTRVVTALALAFGAGFFVLGVATGLLDPAQGLVFALGVIVANVPEGLLPTLTLALALGVQRLARSRSLVKRLSAVETLGATTVICTDKTGTLTEGRMALRAVWAAGRTWSAAELPGAGPEVRELFEAAVLASQATAEAGDPTEAALVRAAADLGLDAPALRGARPLLAAYPFDSFRKRMTLVRETPAGPLACTKGAPRETLALCDALRWGEGERPLTAEVRQALLAEHDRLASEGLRLLAIARRPLPPDAVGAPQGRVERGLTLLGLVALWDPPRPEVAEAVELCRRAGIRAVVVTGDYGLTARAIARRIGLDVTKVVTGDEVERAGPEALRRLVREPGVLFARMSPRHKLAVVQALRAQGEVVAVTGDGVNDAPALKAADIGVAMGRRGTEVAREAAVMVLTDDNFASIVTAVRLGRAIYSNMGKFVTYIFASNVPELVPFLAFVLLGVPLPLTVMQILAVDLGTDLIPALGLGAEPAEPGVMDRPPRRRDERLLGPRRLLHAYGFLGVIEAALSLGAFFWTYWMAGWRPGLPMDAAGDLYRRATTMTLAGIVAAQVGNVFACRTDRESVFRAGLAANRFVLGGVVVEVALLVALILVPPLRRVFGLAPVGFAEWWILLLFPPVVLGLEEARKAWLRARERAG